jgi:hypothetical protein
MMAHINFVSMLDLGVSPEAVLSLAGRLDDAH